MVRRPPAGSMRHTIEIERHANAGTTNFDSYGQISASSSDWVPDQKLRGRITVLSGEEAELARQVYPHARYRVDIDYYSTMDSTGATQKRIRFGSRYQYIGAVINPDEENVYLQLLCGEDR